MRTLRNCLALLLACQCFGGATLAAQDTPELAWFFQAASKDEREARAAQKELAANWRIGYTALLIDLARLMPAARRPAVSPDRPGPETTVDEDRPDPVSGGGAALDSLRSDPIDPASRIRTRLLKFLEDRTRQRFGDDLGRWREWLWALPYEPHPRYAEFKGIVYGQIDPRMRSFFPAGARSLIRLDEIDWGGVRVNGIPPLDHPKYISAADAAYLKDGHIVFGLEINGEARAYPRRILAWHEMARDKVGGVELTIVYCTLCGTVIPYESAVAGRTLTFGTSGLLYRSNKLMFDEETNSLWSTFEGKPVVGSLSDSDVELQRHAVVTTTWGEWRRDHPNTTVLALETGHKRDYSEGAAYRDYFATDRLMFRVPRVDNRLKNKAEVLTFFVPWDTGATQRQAVATAADFLKKQPIYHLDVGGVPLVVLTTREGANRVYATTTHRLAGLVDPMRVRDVNGRVWRITERALVADDDAQAQMARVPAQRAFWFGWYAQFPDTLLITKNEK